MAAPVLSSFAQRIYDSMVNRQLDDPSYQYALANYCAAVGRMFQLLDDYGRDQIVNGRVASGWSQLLDINRAPTEALPWLGQFMGVIVDVGLSDANQRTQIKSVGGYSRGTPAAMIAAAQTTLTGTKQVTFLERTGGSAYSITVITKASETPNPLTTFAALISQKPAGININYQNLVGQTYQDLFATNAATYQIAFTIYSNYQNLLLNNQGPVSTNTYGTGTYGSGNYGG